ncbi:unnamed protein product [Cyprideis torosa]|uniref:Uncharacterized protein n=1 Tax=Cyprideis torosa TaxID=163714 RepID=A0A7R8ZJD9_9CRUS|nr:unnamed protein product [Cyprideis torosa]CAG0886743.1 unnamed protein product [Cyprideis torosa]
MPSGETLPLLGGPPVGRGTLPGTSGGGSGTYVSRSGTYGTQTPSSDIDIGIGGKETPTRDSLKAKLTQDSNGLTLSWQDLSVYVPKVRRQSLLSSVFRGPRRERGLKKVINNVTGIVRPGTLLAIMGASGAGKTTLMNVLAGRAGNKVLVDGKVFVNGYPHAKVITDLCGYIHQEDMFFGSLTVKEHLQFMAVLRMDRHCTDKARSSRVDEILVELGLKGCENTSIGIPGKIKGISGGEKKRLAFATEVLTDPPLLFCDEPTSGLDSYSAQRLVMLLQDLAAKGKTILCTIHQPNSEIFSKFHDVLLLAEGRTAFLGSTEECLKYFDRMGYKCPATFNPADFYVHTLALIPSQEARSRMIIKRICDNYLVSAPAKEMDLEVQELAGRYVYSSLDSVATDEVYDDVILRNMRKKANWVTQTKTLMKRSLLEAARNPVINRIRTVQKTVLGLMFGLIYMNLQLDQIGIQNVSGALFGFVTENTYPSLYGVLNVFPSEVFLVMREYQGGLYRADCYYIAKMIALIPGFIFEPFLFTTICYFMIGLRMTAAAYFLTLASTILTAQVASAAGMLFSAAFESFSMSVALLLPFDMTFFIAGGLLIQLNSMPVYLSWLKWVSWFRYSYESLLITQLHGIDFAALMGHDSDPDEGEALCLLWPMEAIERQKLNSNSNPTSKEPA